MICQSCAMPLENIKLGTNAEAHITKNIVNIVIKTANTNGLQLQ